MTKRYHRCSKCGNKAVWFYVPDTKGPRCYCDEHVPRGCPCNLFDIVNDGIPKNEKLLWWSKKTYADALGNGLTEDEIGKLATAEQLPDSYFFEIADERGRRQPCCEYDYCPEGDEIEQREYTVTKTDIIRTLEESRLKLSISDRMRNDIANFCVKLNEECDYNYFMSRFHDVCHTYFKGAFYSAVNFKFYRSFKERLRKTRIKKLFLWE